LIVLETDTLKSYKRRIPIKHGRKASIWFTVCKRFVYHRLRSYTYRIVGSGITQFRKRSIRTQITNNQY
jgi:hypothetical protein